MNEINVSEMKKIPTWHGLEQMKLDDFEAQPCFGGVYSSADCQIEQLTKAVKVLIEVVKELLKEGDL